VTIGAVAPPNLYHFVCENGTYEANGGHPIPGRDRVDFAGFARAAGYRVVFDFSDLEIFRQQIGALLGETGPVFVDLKISASGPGDSVGVAVARNEQTRYKTFWAMVIADKTPKKKEKEKDRKVAEGGGTWGSYSSFGVSENPISAVKNFVCKYLC
jgi:hypothetical protein